jgi:hypothetical protein
MVLDRVSSSPSDYVGVIDELQKNVLKSLLKGPATAINQAVSGTTRMKVLVYTETFWPSMGGLERNSFTLANCLAADGHQVMLMTRTRTESADNYAFNVLRTTSKRDFIHLVRWSDLVIINGGVAAKICLPAIVFGKPYILIYQSSGLFEREGSGILISRMRASARASKLRKLQHPLKESSQQLAQ